jgi:Protein of unknown function, DUF547
MYAGQMLDCGIFHSLQGKSHPSRVFDDKALYRLQCYHTPDVLNSYREWKEDLTLDSMTLLDCLFDMMQAMEAAAMDQDGVVDMSKVAKLAQFPVFEEATCALQTADLDEMDEATKMVRRSSSPYIYHLQQVKVYLIALQRSFVRQAFGINVYNLMIKYAMVKVGLVPSKKVGARIAFYSAICFNIGGYLYSFEEWEHGILRGNAKPPHGAAEVFSRTDVRRLFIAKHLDPRIHFCLHRGTRTCPPLVRFSIKHLKRELAAAAATFCEKDGNVQFDK